MKLLSLSSQLSQPLKISKLLIKSNHSRLYSILSNPQPDLKADHVVIGGGVVGLAVTNYLSQGSSNATTILLEKNEALGQETR
jgi:heterodisulfide reductase subunit A-like polyferredoxin